MRFRESVRTGSGSIFFERSGKGTEHKKHKRNKKEGPSCAFCASCVPFLLVGIARKFQVWQPYVTNKEIAGLNRTRRLKTGGARRSNQVILLDTVAADAETAHQTAVLI